MYFVPLDLCKARERERSHGGRYITGVREALDMYPRLRTPFLLSLFVSDMKNTVIITRVSVLIMEGGKEGGKE